MLSLYLSMVETEEEKSLVERLYNSYRNDMYRIAYAITKNKTDAEDALHSAFLNIIKNISIISEISCQKTRAYLFTVVRNTAINIHNEKKSHASIGIDEDIADEIPAATELEDDLLSRFEYNRVVEEISKLSPIHKDVLVLSANGYTVSEMAEMLNISTENVYKRISRARKLLKAAIEKETLYERRNTTESNK